MSNDTHKHDAPTFSGNEVRSLEESGFIVSGYEERTLRDVSPRLASRLDEYAKERREIGGFLRACLENDFVEAATRADHVNATMLPQIARHICNELPQTCWGSKEKVKAWLAGGEVL